jgi:Protein of unknown function (DUF3667)
MAAVDVNQCRNCGSALASDQKYCGRCGQKSDAGRLTIEQLGHDLLHALTHVDRSVLSLLWPLIVRPGTVARDYVDGKRKRYFGPLSWLIVIVGLVSAEVALSGFQVVISNNPNPLADLLQRHANVVFLIQVPVLALFCRLLFWRDRFNTAEFLVLAAYTASMRTIFYGVVLVPLSSVFHPGQTAEHYWLYATLLAWIAYFGFAASQFVNGRRALAAFKGVAAVFLTQAATQIALSIVGTIWAEIRA